MADRLQLALEAGAVALSEDARVVMLRAGGDAWVPEGAVVEQGFRPDFEALERRGIRVVPVVEGVFDVAVVCIVKAKAETRALIAQAMGLVPVGAPIIVDGAKGEGIDSILKLCRGIADVSAPFSKAHGKCFSFANPGVVPEGWAAAETVLPEGFVTRPGVFSADGIDPGSALLMGALPPLKGAVCDLGAGWGYLSAALLARGDAVSAVDLVEAEFAAVEAAKRNVTDARAVFHWADARGWAGRYDAVISNPPFHVGRVTTPELGQAFIQGAAQMLKPNGRFYMVANRHLPYEGVLAAAFGETVVLAETGAYKVISAARPTRAQDKRRR